MIYPSTVSDFDQLFSLSCRHWFKTLRQIFLYIVIFVGLLALAVHIPMHKVFHILLEMIITVIALFLFSMALYRADALLKQQPVSFMQASKVIIQRILKVLAAVLIFVISIILIALLVKWVMFSLFRLEGAIAVLGLTLIGGLPIMAGLIFFYFTVPLIAVDNESLWMAFYRSADLTQQNWLYVFGLYTGMIVILIALLPYTLHAHWLKTYYLMEVFNLSVLCLLLPLLINMTLFIMRSFQINENKSPHL